MTKPIEREAQIIFDRPADQDAFDGGGHERSAKALAEAIEQLANRDGAIGLEGSWGAGKSTVINLAQEALEKRTKDSNEYHVFTFDLWEHQSDDFRRAFLEEFINWLRIKKHLKAKVAKQVKDRIRNRVKTVSTTKLKEYSFFAAVLLLITPLVPLLYAWMGPAAFRVDDESRPLQVDIGSFHFDEWHIGLAVFALAYLAFLIKVIFDMFEVVKDENGNQIKFGFSAKLQRAVSRSLSLFAKDIDKEDSKQSIREVDPTTVEFHGVFRDLLSKVQKKNKRMVFILDNIDRLPANQVPEVWSEVRSLFSNTTFESYIDNAWVTAVIPYDKPFVKKAFGADLNSVSVSGSTESDIIGKTFSVILHVAPPVATDWRNFFMAQLDSAFTPPFEPEDKFRLFRMLKYFFQEKGTHPTPRVLITFINEIIALWMQWGGIIRLEAIALYIIHRPEIEGAPASILNSGLIDDHYKNIANLEDWQRDFAALSYNVDPETAYQVLLQQPLVSALTSEGPDELVELAKSKIGFSEVFMDALDEALGSLDQKEAHLVSNIAKNIDTLDLSAELRNEVWRKMATETSQVQRFNITQMHSFEGVFAVLENQTPDRVLSFANLLKQKLTASVPIKSGEEVESEGPTFREHGYAWLQAISKIGKIIEAIKGKGKRDEFYNKTQIPNNSDVSLGVAYACSEIDDMNFGQLALKAASESVVGGFTYQDLVEGENPTKRFRAALNEVEHLISDEDCTRLLELVSKSMRSQDIKTSEDRSELIKIYLHLYYSGEDADRFKSNLDSLANDGTLIWHGNKASEDGDIETIATIQWLMFVVFGHKNSSRIPDQHPTLGPLGVMKDWYNESISTAEVADEQVDILADLVAKHDRFGSLLKPVVEGLAENKIYTKVLAKVLEQKKYTRLPIESCVYQYARIKEAVGQELAKDFLNEFALWKPSFEEQIKEEDVHKISTDFILDASEIKSSKDYETIFNKVDKHLHAATQQDWEASLKAEDDRLRLLVARRKSANFTLLAEIYRPALLSHILSILKGEYETSKFANNYTEIFKALKEANRIQLAADVIKDLNNVPVSKSGCEVLIQLLPELVDQMPYVDNADNALDHFFSKIISSDLENVRSFIQTNSSTIKKCLKKADKVSSKSFEENIESLEESADDASLDWYIELRKLFGIKKKPKPANDEISGEQEKDKV